MVQVFNGLLTMSLIEVTFEAPKSDHLYLTEVKGGYVIVICDIGIYVARFGHAVISKQTVHLDEQNTSAANLSKASVPKDGCFFRVFHTRTY